MLPVEAGSSHLVRCVRFDEIDWSVATAKTEQHDPVQTGEIVLNVSDMSKHYAIESGGAVLLGAKKTVKANENITFRAREAETIAIVGESGCGKSTFAKVLMDSKARRTARFSSAKSIRQSAGCAKTQREGDFPACR